MALVHDIQGFLKPTSRRWHAQKRFAYRRRYISITITAAEFIAEVKRAVNECAHVLANSMNMPLSSKARLPIQDDLYWTLVNLGSYM